MLDQLDSAAAAWLTSGDGVSLQSAMEDGVIDDRGDEPAVSSPAAESTLMSAAGGGGGHGGVATLGSFRDDSDGSDCAMEAPVLPLVVTVPLGHRRELGSAPTLVDAAAAAADDAAAPAARSGGIPVPPRGVVGDPHISAAANEHHVAGAGIGVAGALPVVGAASLSATSQASSLQVLLQRRRSAAQDLDVSSSGIALEPEKKRVRRF